MDEHKPTDFEIGLVCGSKLSENQLFQIEMVAQLGSAANNKIKGIRLIKIKL